MFALCPERRVLIYPMYLISIITTQHLFLHLISDDSGHSEAHYSITHPHIIKLMIMKNTFKMHDQDVRYINSKMYFININNINKLKLNIIVVVNDKL